MMSRFPGPYLILVLISTLFLSACEGDRHLRRSPVAEKGVLDLRNWDFSKDGTAELSGEWKFYWKKLLDPSLKDTSEMTSFYRIPELWTDHNHNGNVFPGDGYATYTLSVLLPHQPPPLAIRITEVVTAYALYINGKKICKNGVVGVNKEISVPEYLPLTADFSTSQERIELVMHVSNFHHRKGGIWEAIELGSKKKLRQTRDKSLALNIFLIGVISIMGLYHLGLYLLRKNDRSTLYFGIFCCVITMRGLTTGERYFNHLFSEAGWELSQKIEYLSFYLGVPLFLAFVRVVFPHEYSKKIFYLIVSLSILFSGLVLFTPARVYSHSAQSFQIITSLASLHLIFVLIQAIRKKRRGAFAFLAGFLFLFATIINDFLLTNEIVHTGYYISLGLFVFIFCQAFLISSRFSNAFALVEAQTEELVDANIAYEKQIDERRILEQSLLESYENFQDSRLAIILGLAKLAEYRDENTGSHLERIREYSKVLTSELAKTPKYVNYITEDYIKDIFHSAILHDIGKVGISDSILLKPGTLNPDEFDSIKRHCKIGGDAIMAVESNIKVQSFLTLGREIAYNHHERWDGTGYPARLKNDDIPLSARIVALADVYDALTTERPYKDAFSHEKALGIIQRDKGSHFDPDIVDAFMNIENKFNEIRQNYDAE